MNNKYKKVPVCIGIFTSSIFDLYHISVCSAGSVCVLQSDKLERSNGKGFCGFR